MLLLGTQFEGLTGVIDIFNVFLFIDDLLNNYFRHTHFFTIITLFYPAKIYNF